MTSPLWARAFAKGSGGQLDWGDELQAGDVALFGSAKRWRLLAQARAIGRTWWYGDHAYFGRREYFRITRNAWQHGCTGRGDPARLDACGVRVGGWRRAGSYVLLCPNSPEYFALHGLDCGEWIRQTGLELARHTDREIRVRFKTDALPLEEDLRQAWAVVVFTSVSGVHAALAGVPCFATAPCASQAFGSDDLALIENPVRPDNRFDMAAVLAANQWTLHEIASGRAWRDLNDDQAVEGLDLS
jgi:hypothetical protein